TPGAATTPPPAAPAPVKPVETKPTTGNKNNKKAAVVPELPSASNSASKLASGPVDVKVQNVSTNQPLPVINIDEPPPSPGPKPILKPVSGGVLNGTAVSLPPPVYPDAAKRMRTQGVV